VLRVLLASRPLLAGESGSHRRRQGFTERRGQEARRRGRDAARCRIHHGGLGSRSGIRRSVCRGPPGPSGWNSHHPEGDRDVVLRRREGLHEEGGLALGKRTAARTDVGRVREMNEDRYLVRVEPSGTLLAVADGVGGEAGGELASSAAIEALSTRFFGASAGLSRADGLAAAMRAANDAVLGAAAERGQKAAEPP